MAGAVYFKSFLWLTALGGLGYGLLQLTQPSEEKLSKIREYSKSTSLTEEEKRKILFMQKLQEAAGESKPVYIQRSDKDNK